MNNPERDANHPEKLVDLKPLLRFSADLNLLKDQSQLDSSLLTYITAEFGSIGESLEDICVGDSDMAEGSAVRRRHDADSQAVSEKLHEQIINGHNLNDPELHDDKDSGRAADAYRIAILTDVIELYMNTHSHEECVVWLPRAMRTVFPEGNQHSSQTCPTYGIQNKTDGCELSDVACPVNITREMLVEACINPSFDRYDFVMDAKQASSKTKLFLRTAAQVGAVTQEEKVERRTSFEKQYRAQFKRQQ